MVGAPQGTLVPYSKRILVVDVPGRGSLASEPLSASAEHTDTVGTAGKFLMRVVSRAASEESGLKLHSGFVDNFVPFVQLPFISGWSGAQRKTHRFTVPSLTVEASWCPKASTRSFILSLVIVPYQMNWGILVCVDGDSS